MRALTLTQPWCGLVAAGIKLVENRSRRMAPPEVLAGEMFALHASKVIDHSIYERIRELAPDYCPSTKLTYELPWYDLTRITCAVIGVARVERVLEPLRHGIALHDPDARAPLPIDQQRWFFGPVGYVLRDVRRLPESVPCKGMLGFWTMSDDIEGAVRRQLQEAA